MRLGRLPHDPERLAEAPRHTFGAVPAPVRLDRSSMDYRPGLYDNDKYSNCTIVSLFNAARAVAKIQKYVLNVDPSLPLKDFADFLGNPVNLLAVEGAVMQDVLDWQAKNGLNVCYERLYGVPKTIDLTNRQAVALAIWGFGHLWLGIDLRERDMENFESLKPWDVEDGRDDGEVVGGHAVNVWDYTGLKDGDTCRCGTWGSWQSFTWDWLKDRGAEAHILEWNQLKAAPVRPEGA